MRTIAEIFSAHEVLDASGRHVGGTDKHGPNHCYGDAYECLFPDRAAIALMMEVGVADGSSLLAWREIFPRATCVGLDIHPSELAQGERIEFHLGDATNRADCERAAGGRMFDLIVDDAAHVLADTLTTLMYLWPSVRQGGMYVVEEFSNIGSLHSNIQALWPQVTIVDTIGPRGGVEPLVVFRKQ